MNVLTSRSARTGDAPRSTTLIDRFTAAVPLASIYLWLCIVYGVEAWKRATPWLFTDELEMTQISRAYAATGHPARRGAPYSFHSLYPVLTAPVWWIHDVATAYAALKYVDVIVMASVVFPTYFLARLVVRRSRRSSRRRVPPRSRRSHTRRGSSKRPLRIPMPRSASSCS